MQRIGAAGVFRQRIVVEIRHAVLVEHDIFEHGAETAGRGIDFRLGFGRKLDRLGIAAAFEVEDSVFAPAMLVIADQRAGRIGRQRRLAGAGKAEEHRGIAFGADIGRAMHRHDALGRQKIVEDSEYRLLVLTGIGCAADEDEAVGEIAGDHGFGAAPVTLGVSLEARQVDDGQLLFERAERIALRTDQKIADEQRMPCVFSDDTRGKRVVGIGTADKVLDEKLPARCMGEHISLQNGKMLRRHGLVIIPPDLVFGHGIAHDELVLRRTAGVLAGDRA
ncbi:hypothetical protein D3C73_529080 [compost metagenome]